MRSSHSLDRLDVTFDGTQLVADAGLLLPATLAQRLGLRELVEEHLDLGKAPGRANAGDKLLALVMSALGGGDTSTLRARSAARATATTLPSPRRSTAFTRPSSSAGGRAWLTRRADDSAGPTTSEQLGKVVDLSGRPGYQFCGRPWRPLLDPRSTGQRRKATEAAMRGRGHGWRGTRLCSPCTSPSPETAASSPRGSSRPSV